MSRIGDNPVLIPDGVSIDIKGQLIVVKGTKGSMDVSIHPEMKVSKKDNYLIVSRPSDHRKHKALHGTTRQIIASAVTGVSEGYKKELEINGIGFQANIQSERLVLQLGFSHDIIFEPPEGIKIMTGSRTEITVSGFDKQLVGEVAAKIRSFRKPEPYKGKGIRYKGEYVRSKQGKTVGGVG
ncbi:MAG: 50S ribosomal protein L6 [Candidatus Neomarinimicrobiota bacterium]